jgi:hypothetical protein
MHFSCCGYKLPKMWAPSVIKNMSIHVANNHPMSENTPNLVTLLPFRTHNHFHFELRSFHNWFECSCSANNVEKMFFFEKCGNDGFVLLSKQNFLRIRSTAATYSLPHTWMDTSTEIFFPKFPISRKNYLPTYVCTYIREIGSQWCKSLSILRSMILVDNNYYYYCIITYNTIVTNFTNLFGLLKAD